MNQDDELNHMFKEGLSEPGHHAEYREADWDALEQMLDEPKRRGVVFWLPYLGSAAAVLLACFGWWFFKPAGDSGAGKPTVVVNQPKVDSDVAGTSVHVVTQPTTETKQSQPVIAATATNDVSKPTIGGKPNTDVTAHKPAVHHHIIKQLNGGGEMIAATARSRNGNSSASDVIKDNGKPKPPATETTLAAVTPEKNTTENTVPATTTEKNNDATTAATNILATNKPEITKAVTANRDSAAIAKPATTKLAKIASSSPTHFALTVLAASDLNGVGTFSGSQAGANVGLLFSVGKGKFTLSTGAMYSKTPYGTDFSNYHTGYYFTTKPAFVNADCRILDIPIDLHYQVFGNFKNKFSAGAGLSSYLMLNEDYTYTYADPTTPGPTGYSTNNRNKHYFGVLDLDILYQHRLNSKFSLDLQPYLRLPLTQIGYGKVQLQSAGMAVGFSWNIK